MSDRRAELERKKAKLQALREEKDRRRREKELLDVEEATQRANSGTDRNNRRQIDEMLSALGVAPVSDVLSSLSSMNSLPSDTSINHTPDTSLQPSSLTNSNSTVNQKQKPQLSVVAVQVTDIPPRDLVVYTKQTQTVHTGPDRDAHATDYYVLTFDDLQAEDEDSSSLPHIDGFASKLPPGILPHGLPHVKEVQPAVTALEQEQNEKKDVKEIRELSEDEKQMIILSEEFQRFMDRTGRMVERALCESVDVCVDYAGGTDSKDNLDEKSHQRLSLNRSFVDERWSKNRCVTSLDWSPQFPELLLASYHRNEICPNDPDGVCLVWNTKFKKTTPEYIFHCQSPVLTATFAKFHPNLILGGTYSGQIVLWDNRVQKRSPIQRTPLSAIAHTHPVFCMSVVGTQNAHNLISISTDGRLCSWSLDNLSAPQETLELHRQPSKPVAVTSLAFPHSDVNNFVIGSEEGLAYSACRHGSKAGITDAYEAHHGPITGISYNAVQNGPIDFSHLFLTSSMDWTIKLWSMKDNKPLYSFEDNGDYVLDVAWSPIHPALFAAVDCDGRLDLWNLNQDTEVPSASTVVEGCALKRVSWTPSGLHVTAGDDTGTIWVYDVAESFAHPRHDEWNKFMYTTQELRISQVDAELEKLNLKSTTGVTPPLSSLGSVNPLR